MTRKFLSLLKTLYHSAAEPSQPKKNFSTLYKIQPNVQKQALIQLEWYLAEGQVSFSFPSSGTDSSKHIHTPFEIKAHALFP